MKAALLFVGRIKTWEHCYDSFKKHILDVLTTNDWEVDGFLCHNSENDLKITCGDDCTYCRRKDATSASRIDEFINKYQIRKFSNIPPCDSSIFTFCEKCHMSPIRMHYFWNKGFELIETMNIHYDMVIYLRADQLFKSNIMIPTLPIPDDTLYVPNGNDYTGLNDQFAIGSMASMKHYTNSYNKIMDINKETKLNFHTETYLKIHTKCMNVIRFDLSYVLHRGRNNK